MTLKNAYYKETQYIILSSNSRHESILKNELYNFHTKLKMFYRQRLHNVQDFGYCSRCNELETKLDGRQGNMTVPFVITRENFLISSHRK